MGRVRVGSRGWFVLRESVDPLCEHVLGVYGRKRFLVRGVILYIYIYINVGGGHMMVVVERGFEGGSV